MRDSLSQIHLPPKQSAIDVGFQLAYIFFLCFPLHTFGSVQLVFICSKSNQEKLFVGTVTERQVDCRVFEVIKVLFADLLSIFDQNNPWMKQQNQKHHKNKVFRHPVIKNTMPYPFPFDTAPIGYHNRNKTAKWVKTKYYYLYSS